MNPPSLLSLLLPAVAAGLAAQTPARLIGITRTAPALRQIDPTTCNPIGQCVLPGMPNSAALPPFVGGTAWNPVRSGAWVTNGVVIAQYDDACGPMCPPVAIPSLGPNAFITGLEYVEGLDQLWMIDSLGNLHFYTNACPPVLIGVCATGLGPTPIGNVTTGLAVDEGNGLVFIAYPQLPGGANVIVVTQLAAPCVPVQQIPIPPCLGGIPNPILGLAVDWGNQVLYATNGLTADAINYVPAGPGIAITGVNCCLGPIVIADRMIGLAIRPGGATPAGTSCANGPCAPCPQLHTLRNDPNLGNAAFALGLDQAQPGSFAWCLIGVGPCQVPGVTVPPLCGDIYTIPYLGNIGPVPVAGPGVCGGSATFPLPLPVAPALANAVFSSQCLSLCFGGGVFGIAQSACISWQLQGN
jgi:hypothetical protein